MVKEAFVKVEEPAASSSSLETGHIGVDWLSDSALLCVCLPGPLWRLDRLVPPLESIRPPCLVCMSAFPVSLGGISLCTPHFPFQIGRLECYNDQGKIINCSFVLAAAWTGENKLMVMKPYRVRFRRWVWCDLPSSGEELSSQGSPLWAQARSQLTELQHILMLKCCFFHCFQTQHPPTHSPCRVIIHPLLPKGQNIVVFAVLLSFLHSPFYHHIDVMDHDALCCAFSVESTHLFSLKLQCVTFSKNI